MMSLKMIFSTLAVFIFLCNALPYDRFHEGPPMHGPLMNHGPMPHYQPQIGLYHQPMIPEYHIPKQRHQKTRPSTLSKKDLTRMNCEGDEFEVRSKKDCNLKACRPVVPGNFVRYEYRTTMNGKKKCTCVGCTYMWNRPTK
ncbi:hypothetical protein GJ496_012060 [Pomphorhynchus laevis]|nr:hypothetical protein GJ496_012060 [Pomphorhynchus laevis]